MQTSLRELPPRKLNHFHLRSLLLKTNLFQLYDLKLHITTVTSWRFWYVKLRLTFTIMQLKSQSNFRRHLSSALCFNKLSIGNKFICKVERLNVKQHRFWWDGSLWAVSSESTLFAKAFYHRLWQWKSIQEFVDSDNPAHLNSFLRDMLSFVHII